MCSFEQHEAPGSRSFFTEIIASISDIKFSKDGRHILSRDYMTLKVCTSLPVDIPLLFIDLSHQEALIMLDITWLHNASVIPRQDNQISRATFRWSSTYLHCIAYTASDVSYFIFHYYGLYIHCNCYGLHSGKLVIYTIFCSHRGVIFLQLLLRCFCVHIIFFLLFQLWDINMNSGPVATFQVHEYLRPKVILYMLRWIIHTSLRIMNNKLFHWSNSDSCIASWNCSYVIYMKMIPFLISLSAVKAEMDCE